MRKVGAFLLLFIWLLSRGWSVEAGRRGVLGRFVLRTALDSPGGYLSAIPREDLVGKTGYALTPLRPAGKVSIEGERVDAVADGSFLPVGAAVSVAKVEGGRVVVEPAGDPAGFPE